MNEGTFTGINIRYPISRLILEGSKSVETRTYPIPKHYIGRTLLMVETPGTTGKFKARIVAKITFGESFRYASKAAFYRDISRHQVGPDSPWAWIESKPKWGWPIKKVERLRTPIQTRKRLGIKFTKDLVLR